MDIIIDTDILSTFSKINKVSLLKRLFSKSKFYISSKNEAELLEAKKLGYTFVARALTFSRIKLTLNENEKLDFRKLKAAKSSLSSADIESIILAKS